jgi:TorA maturation chaperone TorD
MAVCIESLARAGVYRFLAEVFTSHPTRESVRRLSGLAAEFGIQCPDKLSPGTLEREYMDLFVAPNPLYVAPYESVFRDRWLVPAALKPGSDPGEASLAIKGLVMGESTLAVQRCYVDAGLAAKHDLPDHVGNELRFMAYLWTQQAEAPPDEAARAAELREEFRMEHLLKWTGDLRARIAESDRLGYYRAAIEVVEGVLMNDG